MCDVRCALCDVRCVVCGVWCAVCGVNTEYGPDEIDLCHPKCPTMEEAVGDMVCSPVSSWSIRQ